MAGIRRVGRRWWLVAAVGMVTAVAAVPLLGVTPAQARPASTAPSAGKLVPGTPCAVGAAACVALGHAGFNGKAWYIKDGRVVRGPVDASTGGPGEDTPIGTFHVLSKDLNHASTETRNAEGAPSPMPYSVFFTKSGVAFHGGGNMATRTAGCIRLSNADARFFYNTLNIGDTVQVVNGGGDYGDEEPSHHSGGGGLLGGL
jgi:lipoprotein-anchoring transpeptidase ErfK/SrfK